MMVKIRTPIPEYWVERWRQYWRQRVIDRLWQLFVVIVAAVIVTAVVLAGPGFILAFLIGTTLSVILSDDIRKTISDVWNRNFWVWRVER